VPAQLFYSYSHKDEKLRDRLEVHLSALKREGLISGWHDRKIGAGTEWKNAIDDNLKAASIILLLVSPDFLASDYCYDVELKFAMEQHEKGQARVIPVILQPCDWNTSIFAKLQALPKDAKPITKWDNRNDAFLNVVKGIREALGGVGHGGPSAAISPPALNALHQLPAPPADFTGRQQELKELLAAVKTGGVTISGLQGLGGVGKTALALKLAEQLKLDYPDAQFYLDLKGVTQPLTPRDAMAYIVRAWHPKAQLPENPEELAPIYRSVLEGKRALLLMDNARDAQQVAPLIPPAGCILLVTSRRHFTLPGLVEKNLDKLPPTDARDLLLRIAPRLKKEKTDQVDELARLCGHLPLALRAVASALQTTKNITLADCVRNMADRRQRLKLTEADAALQSSYELLSAAAGAVWEVPQEASQEPLGQLLAYSLLEYDETTKRYSLHDLVRLFAGQLLNADERYSGQKRHAGHYLSVLATANDLYIKGGESVTVGLALFDMEVTNIQAGHNWVVAHQQDDNSIAEWCCEYPNTGVYCLSLRQHPRERIRWLETALAAAKRLKRRSSEGASLGNLGIVYKNLGEYRRAIEYHNQHLQITRETGYRGGEGVALGNLGVAYDRLGEHRRAIEYQEKRLEIVREIGDRLGEGLALGNLGLAYHSLGEHRRAVEYHEQHLQITRETGDRLGEGQALGNLGLAYGSLGQPHRAIEYYEQRLQIAREIGDRMGEGTALGNTGIAYYNMGDYRRAIEYYGQQLQIAQEITYRLGEANSLFNSALALDQLGDRPAAIDSAEAAFKNS
jgi:tetratricopeptide (TPR) repeat protein